MSQPTETEDPEIITDAEEKTRLGVLDLLHLHVNLIHGSSSISSFCQMAEANFRDTFVREVMRGLPIETVAELMGSFSEQWRRDLISDTEFLRSLPVTTAGFIYRHPRLPRYHYFLLYTRRVLTVPATDHRIVATHNGLLLTEHEPPGELPHLRVSNFFTREERRLPELPRLPGGSGRIGAAIEYDPHVSHRWFWVFLVFADRDAGSVTVLEYCNGRFALWGSRVISYTIPHREILQSLSGSASAVGLLCTLFQQTGHYVVTDTRSGQRVWNLSHRFLPPRSPRYGLCTSRDFIYVTDAYALGEPTLVPDPYGHLRPSGERIYVNYGLDVWALTREPTADVPLWQHDHWDVPLETLDSYDPTFAPSIPHVEGSVLFVRTGRGRVVAWDFTSMASTVYVIGMDGEVDGEVLGYTGCLLHGGFGAGIVL